MTTNMLSKIAAKIKTRLGRQNIFETGATLADSGSIPHSRGFGAVHPIKGIASADIIDVKPSIKGGAADINISGRDGGSGFNLLWGRVQELMLANQGSGTKNVGSQLALPPHAVVVPTNGSGSKLKGGRKKQPDLVTAATGTARRSKGKLDKLSKDVSAALKAWIEAFSSGLILRMRFPLDAQALLVSRDASAVKKFISRLFSRANNSGQNRNKGNTVAQTQAGEAAAGSVRGRKGKSQLRNATNTAAETSKDLSTRVTPTPTVEAASANNLQAVPSHPFLARLGQGIHRHLRRNRGIYGALGGGIAGSTVTNMLAGDGGSGISQEDLLRMSQWQQAYNMAVDQRSFWLCLFGDMQSVQGNFLNNLKNYGWTDLQIKNYRKRFAGA